MNFPRNSAAPIASRPGPPQRSALPLNMIPHVLASLRTVADFLYWQQRFAGVRGFLHELEGYMLLQLAAHGGGTGAIVEIGSFMGRSTAYLAAGSKSNGREMVVAVDHFRGSPENQVGEAYADPTLALEGTTLRVFKENLAALALSDHVTTLVQSSAQAAASWRGPIRLLFIDADHSYESSRADFELWSPHVVSHGLVCFHDITNWPGVTQFYQELLSTTEEYQEVGGVVSLRVLQKRGPVA